MKNKKLKKVRKNSFTFTENKWNVGDIAKLQAIADERGVYLATVVSEMITGYLLIQKQ